MDSSHEGCFLGPSPHPSLVPPHSGPLFGCFLSGPKGPNAGMTCVQYGECMCAAHMQCVRAWGVCICAWWYVYTLGKFVSGLHLCHGTVVRRLGFSHTRPVCRGCHAVVQEGQGFGAWAAVQRVTWPGPSLCPKGSVSMWTVRSCKKAS